jgi:DNA-binding transcriptional LysR family regulator
VGDRALRLAPLGAQPNVWAGSPTLSIRAGATARELSRFTVITTPPPTPMYRITVAWFAAAEQKPGPLCVCTSVNAAAQLAAAGIGIGIFPARMIEASHLAGSIAAIATDPPPPVGRVYVADRVTADQSRTEAVMRVLQSVTRKLDYFGPPG